MVGEDEGRESEKKGEESGHFLDAKQNRIIEIIGPRRDGNEYDREKYRTKKNRGKNITENGERKKKEI